MEQLLQKGVISAVYKKLTDPKKLCFLYQWQFKPTDATQQSERLRVYWKNGDYGSGESAWNEALAYAVDRAFKFFIVPPTAFVYAHASECTTTQTCSPTTTLALTTCATAAPLCDNNNRYLNLDDVLKKLPKRLQADGVDKKTIHSNVTLIQSWIRDAPDLLVRRWKQRNGEHTVIGVNVAWYGVDFHPSSGPRKFDFDKDTNTVSNYKGDTETVRHMVEVRMFLHLTNCPKSAHGWFFDHGRKRWVLLDNDRCLGKRQQPFPRFLFVCTFPRDIVERLRQAYANKRECHMVKNYMKEHDPIAAAEVIPRFKRDAGEHSSIETNTGSCALHRRLKVLLDHIDWCAANRPGPDLYYERIPEEFGPEVEGQW